MTDKYLVHYIKADGETKMKIWMLFSIFLNMLNPISSTTTYTKFIKYGPDIASTKEVLKSVSGASKITCAKYCTEDVLCSGYNYETSSGLCDLIFGVTQPRDITVSVGTLFFEIISMDCQDILDRGALISGTYHVTIGASVAEVYCDMVTDGGGWTVFLRRQDGSVNFNRNWLDYKSGFGDIEAEFWLGNDLIHGLTTTSGRQYQVRFDMLSHDGYGGYAAYDNFTVDEESTKYLAQFGSYSGTTADCLATPTAKLPFSSPDQDNDLDLTMHLAWFNEGGWWYASDDDTTAHPTGLYGPSPPPKDFKARGIIWHPWLSWWNYLKDLEVKIRPI